MKWISVQVEDELWLRFKAIWTKFYPKMKKRAFLEKVITEYCNRFNNKMGKDADNGVK